MIQVTKQNRREYKPEPQLPAAEKSRLKPDEMAIVPEPPKEVIVSKQPRARSRTFTAKPCTACIGVRELDPTVQAGDNFTRVFATRGNIRYCRCHYCGNTWKDSDVIPQSGS